jgi:hypothetical protein
MKQAYLKNSEKVFDNVPVLIIQLVLSKFEHLVCCYIIDDYAIVVSNFQHIISGVPLCLDVAGDEANRAQVGDARVAPSWKGNGGRVDDSKG